MAEHPSPQTAVVFPATGLDHLLGLLRDDGYHVIGPTVREQVIVYDEIESTAELPASWTDVQEAGTYRLETRSDDRLFGFVVGPHTWKRYLFPPREVVWSATREGESIVPLPALEPERYAFIGVRGCELAAIAVQDRVFAEAPYADRAYSRRRDAAFVVAVNCDEPAPTCFCTSMGTGPQAGPGYDIVLTERVTDGGVEYLAESGSEAGDEKLRALPDSRTATSEDSEWAAATLGAAADAMQRTLPVGDVQGLLQSNLTHPHWEEVGERCLSCTNCTLVCPTCFCHAIEDSLDLTGTTATRTRRWDSCFSLEFSYLHGEPHRASPAARYRQWLTHKLAGWIDQFGVSGCVGCGRCITWCPVGIDLTSEIRQFEEAPV